MKYFSMFTGIGGFEYGVNKAFGVCETRLRTGNEVGAIRPDGDSTDSNNGDGDGWRTRAICIGYSEIDKYADAIYKYNFGGKNYGDATKINERELPDFDLLVGGFPCQAFSIAGKRAGFDDTRGTLFFDVARILKHKRPRHFILENVKGLLSHDSGQTFQTILKVLSDIGYRVEWQILNSKYFGVPQNRERVYIVGHLRGECGCQVFPIRRTDSKTDQEFQSDANQEISRTILARDYKDPKLVADYRNDEGLRVRKEQVSPCLSARRHSETDISTMPPLSVPVSCVNKGEKVRQNGRRFKTDEEPSFTLNTIDRQGMYDGAKIRRLTPTECERLQGFPDGWTAKGIMDGKEVDISDTQRYKTLGNAVTTNVVTEVVRRIYEDIHS